MRREILAGKIVRLYDAAFRIDEVADAPGQPCFGVLLAGLAHYVVGRAHAAVGVGEQLVRE